MLKSKHAVNSLAVLSALVAGAVLSVAPGALAHETDRISDKASGWTTVNEFSLDTATGNAVARICNHNYSRTLECEVKINAEYAVIRNVDSKEKWFPTGTLRPEQCVSLQMSPVDDGVTPTEDDQFNPEKPVTGLSLCQPSAAEERRIVREEIREERREELRERAEERREAREEIRNRKRCRYPRSRGYIGAYVGASAYVVPAVPLVLVAPVVAYPRPTTQFCQYGWVSNGFAYAYEYHCRQI